MNKLLNIYNISLDYPEVSGAEQLELLMIRDQIAELETQFSAEKRQTLSEADQKLVKKAKLIEQELSQFVNLANYRKQEDISPQQWWWYLDVLSHLPTSYSSAVV